MRTGPRGSVLPIALILLVVMATAAVGFIRVINASSLVARNASFQRDAINRNELAMNRAIRAFEWFLGRNRLGQPVYDFATGGCRDGIGQDAVNDNEGAESTLAYLQALLALDAAGLQTALDG